MQKENKSHNISKDTFSNFLGSISEPIVILNNEGLILECNGGFANFLGMHKNQLVGKCLFNFSFFDNETKIILKKRLKKRIKVDLVDNHRISIQSKEGRKYVEPKRNRTKYNNELADLVIFHDLTEIIQDQQKLELTLHIEKTNLKRVNDSVKSFAKFPSENPYPVMRISKDKRILYLNEPAKTLLKNLKTNSNALAELNRKSSEALQSGLKKTVEAEID